MKGSRYAWVICAVLVLNFASTAYGACIGGAPNGATQAPEQCDDGNLSNTDSCLSDCTLPFCGDSFVQIGVEDCDGGTCCTAGCLFALATAECRPSAGQCDIAENCTGSSATCPGDSLEPTSTLCRAAIDVCDAAEFCDGSVACPADGVRTNGSVCRTASDLCDAVETCNGSTTTCPADGVKPALSVCRDLAGACDLAEVCNGSTTVCPPNIFKVASDVCSPVAGVCDVAEFCPGNGPSCPANQFEPNTVECRAAVGDCDNAENCLGTAAACPTNTFKPNNTACDDGDVCTELDRCNATGSCAGSCTDTNACTLEYCDVPQGGCVHDAAPLEGMACSDGNPCTDQDACTSTGTCEGSATGEADSDGDGYCDYQEALAGCNADDENEIPAQSASYGGSPAGVADFLLTYVEPKQRDITVSSDPSCAVVGKCNRFGSCPAAGINRKCIENTSISCTSNADCVYGATGFCAVGEIADSCVTNADCNRDSDNNGTPDPLPPTVCRVVVNYADVPGLVLSAVSVNKLPSAAFAPATRGCARKADVVLDTTRTTTRLRIDATATLDGAGRRDRFRYR